MGGPRGRSAGSSQESYGHCSVSYLVVEPGWNDLVLNPDVGLETTVALLIDQNMSVNAKPYF